MGCRVFLHNLSLYTVGVGWRGKGFVRLGKGTLAHRSLCTTAWRTTYPSKHCAGEGSKVLAPADSTRSIHSKEGKSEGEGERLIAALAWVKTGRRRDVWSALPLLPSPPLSSPDCLDFYRLWHKKGFYIHRIATGPSRPPRATASLSTREKHQSKWS